MNEEQSNILIEVLREINNDLKNKEVEDLKRILGRIKNIYKQQI